MNRNKKAAFEKAVGQLNWPIILSILKILPGSSPMTEEEQKAALLNLISTAYENSLRELQTPIWLIRFKKDFSRLEILFVPLQTVKQLSSGSAVSVPSVEPEAMELLALRELLLNAEAKQNYELCAKVQRRIEELEGKGEDHTCSDSERE
ncbi:MAG: hypothetical protein IPP99_00260 [Chitinophagaceae bacterium]|nr:hypothetical protein [Chitinophagaceae bacterium]